MSKREQKFKVPDLVRMKPANTPYGISDAGIGIVTRVSPAGNVYVMFPIWGKPRAMHPSTLQEIK